MTFERYRQIFQNRSFRLFWSGFSFSVLGDAMTRVALTWFVYETTRSAEALGWLMICYTGPILGGGPELYGALLGMLALGEVVSAVLAGSLVLPLSLGALICLAQLLSGTSLSLVLIGRNILSVGAGLFLFGVFSSPLTIWAQTLRMRIIPERLRGRSFALLRMLMQSGNPIGGAIAGILLPALGLPVLIGLSAILVGLPGVLGYQVKTLRQAGGRDDAPEGRLQVAE